MVDDSSVISAGLEGKIASTASGMLGNTEYTQRKMPMTSIDTALETPGVGVSALAWAPEVQSSLETSGAPPAAAPTGAYFYAAYTNGDVLGWGSAGALVANYSRRAVHVNNTEWDLGAHETAEATSLAFTPDRGRLLVGYSDGMIGIWCPL